MFDGICMAIHRTTHRQDFAIFCHARHRNHIAPTPFQKMPSIITVGDNPRLSSRMIALRSLSIFMIYNEDFG